MKAPFSSNKVCARALLLLALALALPQEMPARAQAPATETDYYEIKTVPIPQGVILEVGGMALLPSGALAVSTRRGEIWIVEDPYRLGGSDPHFRLFAQGLHEPLGLAYRDGVIYATQRSELTRMKDTDGDGRADVFETVYSWPLSGNYHEYSYGPIIRPNGNMIVNLNLGWIGYGASLAKWRGWTIEITPDGEMTPIATGLRSPAGYGLTKDGDLFYAENQGDWVGSGRISLVEKGDFLGNPAGLRWTSEPGSPLSLKPEDVPDTGEPLYEVAKRVPELKPPAVWVPHGILGISTSDILQDTVGGAFGPFEGQLFVGDQGHSIINRVFLEKVDGVFQGAVFPFMEGFQSGVFRLRWGKDGSMFVGQTSRGWDATGKAPFGLQRIVWSGKTPFEPRSISARPDGFEITFTRPVDRATASDPASYAVTSFTYMYHHIYGSPVINQEPMPVRAVEVSEDGLRTRIVLDSLRLGYIHEVTMAGVRSADGLPLVHDTGYYTVNRIPSGPRLAVTPNNRAAAGPEIASRTPVVTVSTPVAQAKRVTSMPASWGGKVDASVEVATLPGMRYDLPSFDVKPGAHVRLTLNNNDDMLHNIVVVKPGTADDVAKAALGLGLKGSQMNYVPNSGDVLYHTNLLQPETSESIFFTAPTEPGEYTYICTFPGHSATMRGIMRVVG
ncbi:MAG TPA: plastocyanin/azurin family copper-binding protein [Rhodothermales bacterium]|nr:plastocyanin/azurin family copper-binding protein [Rhodothermales bacterium]